ncbi:hypothetical protein NEHOM01_1850 [Nematocida homosporus]|uniref:uncharacterized protein n=1 Tax=Nematocida homosporus TaxID=1912981 RepID=UPI00221F2AE1|nr:uncharacterized protein NEHOM01_1850 [Nematocida homosporus]KAI5186998.1 hypothetical protein NEHOM01_1850 [Nematocida homosporus]
MNISNNLKQLRFMKKPVAQEKKERETLGTWLLQERAANAKKNPHKKECNR